MATAPIFTFLLAFALTGEQRASTSSLVGVAIGIVGVGMLLGVDAGGGSEALVGGMFIILAAFGYAVAAWYLKRNLGGVEPVATVAGTQVVGRARDAAARPAARAGVGAERRGDRVAR